MRFLNGPGFTYLILTLYALRCITYAAGGHWGRMAYWLCAFWDHRLSRISDDEVAMKISRDELFRQLRERGPEMIEEWIAAVTSTPEFPRDVEVGQHFRVLLCMHPRKVPIDAAVDMPSHLVCEASGCNRSIEFPTPDRHEPGAWTTRWQALLDRGWRVVTDGRGTKELLCPTHAPPKTAC